MHFNKAVPFKEMNYMLTTFHHSKLAHNTNGTITVRGNTNVKNNNYRFQQLQRGATKNYLYGNVISMCPYSAPSNFRKEKQVLFVVAYFLHSFKLRGSSVGIATGYGLDGPGTESRWGRNFPHLSRPAHPAFCTMGTWSFPAIDAAGAWG